jgi:hypothetical protein
MKRIFSLLLAVLAACGDAELVVVDRLAPGGGLGGGGGMGDYAGPTLDILVHLEHDATDFDPDDLMRLLVNGVDRTLELQIGGEYALLRLDPPPVGVPQFVELYRRTGPVLDTFTYNAVPFLGPTLSGVAPDQAMAGESVVLTGTGLSGGPVRVFFGGVEGTVEDVTDTAVTATVPAAALPGFAWVLVGADAAEGRVEFQPLDGVGAPVPFPDQLQIFAAFPGRGGIETLVEVWGVNFDDETVPRFNDEYAARVFGVETVTLPLVGDVVKVFAVVGVETSPGFGYVRLERGNDRSNDLPFTVDGP